MFLKNYFKKENILNDSSASVTFKTMEGTSLSVSGTNAEKSAPLLKGTIRCATVSTAHYEYTSESYIFFGSGTAEPTLDDYTLGSLYDKLSASITKTVDGNNAKSTLMVTVKNTGTSAVTLTEFGIANKFYSSDWGKAPVLVVHDMFDNPITLEPDESKEVIITIQY